MLDSRNKDDNTYEISVSLTSVGMDGVVTGKRVILTLWYPFGKVSLNSISHVSFDSDLRSTMDTISFVEI